VLREEQEIDSLPPSPGEEDDDECKVLTDCPVEYQSCTPTTGGWLACSGMGGGWGSGGVACEIGGCGGGHGIRGAEDWAPGSSSTYPVAASPLFSGLAAISGGAYKLNYELTSVLQTADAGAIYDNAPIFGYASHVVAISLTSQATALATGCFDFRYVAHSAYVTIAKGSARRYKGSDGGSLCAMPGPGIYELRYELDPHQLWHEGDEGNNAGIMRGSLRVRR
jgi:hypothetical protein